jgi:hypothetical protein
MPDYDDQNYQVSSQYSGPGGAPSEYERLAQYQRQQAQQEQFRRLRVQDTRVNMATAMAAQFLHKGNQGAAAAWMTSETGNATRELLGMTIGNGLLGGGSGTHMAMGVSQMFAASNMRVNMAGRLGGGIGTLIGGGAVTDLLAQQAFNHVQNSMFSPVTGLGNTAKTFGFDRSQMGDIFATMGNNRMFAGMKGGSVTTTPQGGISAQLDPQTLKQIEESFKDTAKMLAAVKNITGSDSIRDLAKEARALTGLSIGGTDGPKAITERLRRMSDAADFMGVNLNDMSQRQGQHMALLGQMGITGGMAGALSMQANDDVASAAWGRRGELAEGIKRGKFVRAYSDSELSAITLSSHARLLKENPVLSEAGAILSQEGFGTAETKSALESAMQDLGNATTDSERSVAQQKLAQAYTAHSGFAAGAMTRTKGSAEVRNMISAEHQDAIANITGKLSQGLDKQVIAATQKTFNTGMGIAGAADLATTFMDSFNAQNKAEMLDALGKGDTGAVETIMTQSRDALIKSGVKGEALDALQNAMTADPTKVGQMLDKTMKMARSRTAGHVDKQTLRDRAEHEDAMFWLKHNIGADNKVPGSFMESMLGGYLGDKTMTDQNVINYLESTDSKEVTTIKDFNGNAPATKEGALAMAKALGTYGDIGKALGVKNVNDGGELLTAMQTPEGMSKLARFMRNGVSFTRDANGAMKIVSKKAAEETMPILDATKHAQEMLQLSGALQDVDGQVGPVNRDAAREANADLIKKTAKEYTDHAAALKDAKNPGARAALEVEFAKKEASKITSKFNEGGFMDKASDINSKEFRSIAALYRSNPGTINAALAAQHDALEKDTGGNETHQKDVKKQLAANERLQTALQGGSKDIGTAILGWVKQIEQNTRQPK